MKQKENMNSSKCYNKNNNLESNFSAEIGSVIDRQHDRLFLLIFSNKK
jgi:hypothetical protein